MSGGEHTPTTRDPFETEHAKRIVEGYLTGTDIGVEWSTIDNAAGELLREIAKHCIRTLCQWEAEHRALWAEAIRERAMYPQPMDDYTVGTIVGHNNLLARLRVAGTEAPQ